MTMPLVLLIAVSAVGILFWSVWHRRKAGSRAIESVDFEALRTLMDRREEDFLKAKLSRRNFFRIKRGRIRVVLHYVSRIASNASLVLHAADPARSDPSPEVVWAAAQVMELAAQVRIQCLIAMAKLAAEYAFPSLQLTPAKLAPKYQSMRENLVRLGALKTDNVTPLASSI